MDARSAALEQLYRERYGVFRDLDELVAYDAAGKVIGRRDMKPVQARGVYPCDREKDYGYGVTMCP